MGLPISYPGQGQQMPQQDPAASFTQGLPGLGGLSSLSFRDEKQDDLTRFQVDISQTKADIAHWLNGDTPKEDEKSGKVKWEINTDETLKVLNNFGIREVMRIVNMYLTKDVILSNLKEEKINQMCEDIGEEINDLFFTKYNEIGLNTDSKKKNYSSIIITLTHIIYITLMRAKDGMERKSITENRQVNQTEVHGFPQQRPGLIARIRGRF